MRIPAALICLVLGIGACSSQENHLGPVLTLPARAIAHQISEAPYRARRARVARYVRAHHGALRADIAAGQGQALEQALDLAGHPDRGREATRAQLREDQALFADPEALIVSVMVLSDAA